MVHNAGRWCTTQADGAQLAFFEVHFLEFNPGVECQYFLLYFSNIWIHVFEHMTFEVYHGKEAVSLCLWKGCQDLLLTSSLISFRFGILYEMKKKSTWRKIQQRNILVDVFSYNVNIQMTYRCNKGWLAGLSHQQVVDEAAVLHIKWFDGLVVPVEKWARKWTLFLHCSGLQVIAMDIQLERL